MPQSLKQINISDKDYLGTTSYIQWSAERISDCYKRCSDVNKVSDTYSLGEPVWKGLSNIVYICIQYSRLCPWILFAWGRIYQAFTSFFLKEIKHCYLYQGFECERDFLFSVGKTSSLEVHENYFILSSVPPDTECTFQVSLNCRVWLILSSRLNFYWVCKEQACCSGERTCAWSGAGMNPRDDAICGLSLGFLLGSKSVFFTYFSFSLP